MKSTTLSAAAVEKSELTLRSICRCLADIEDRLITEEIESLIPLPTPSMESWLNSGEYEQILQWAHDIVWEWEPHG